MKPHVDIGPGYLHRWHLIPRNKWCNVYLHRFLKPDPGHDLHDHPWSSVSIVLWGGYREVVRVGAGHQLHTARAGCIIYRSARTLHRIVELAPRGCWTLFVTGPRKRQWGFETRGGWVHHAKYQTTRTAA